MATKHISNFSRYFTNLTRGQQEDLQIAFNDLQNVLDTTSLSTSLELLKRRPNQNLPVPQVTSSITVRGAVLEWEPLGDQRVSFYEIDTSDTSNFASFTTTTTFGFNLALDGLTSTKYARVRGVRRDETVTPYSDTIEINPNIFQVAAHADEDFYIRIVGQNENVVLGGPNSTLEFTPINPEGQSMVWGMCSLYADPAVVMVGRDDINVRVKMKILDDNGQQVSDEVIWKNSAPEYFNTMAIGPFAIQHPPLNYTIQLRVTVQDVTETVDDNTQVQWIHLQVFELGVG